MVPGISSSAIGAIAIGVTVDEKVVVSATGASTADTIVVGVAATTGVIVVAVTSGINGGGCVSGGWRGSEVLAPDETGTVEDDVDATTHGISTAISGRASIRGRGASGGAEGNASEVIPPSDWLPAGEEEEEAAEDVEAAAYEVLNGGVAGSRKR